MKKTDCIFVAGHNGLAGSAIVRKLLSLEDQNILTRNRTQVDLMDQQQVEDFFQSHQIDYVFDAAARVGGIHANNTYSAEFIYENTLIQTNLIHFAHTYGVKRFLFLGSVCIYPKYAPTPVKEDALMTGILEQTNEAYAMAKLHGIQMLKAYKKQYGMKGVSLMPANLYGPGDNYHPLNSHVIPALLQKFHVKKDPVVCWGDGTSWREFLYVDDLADACIFAMNHYSDAELINVSSGQEVSIEELAKIIADVTGYTGAIEWDTSKPNGTPKRPLDCSKLRAKGWKPQYTLRDGLRKTYQSYLKNMNP